MHLNYAQSHPSWVCGLKHVKCNLRSSRIASHPSWVCGLKHMRTFLFVMDIVVTPFVGVWIETWCPTPNWEDKFVTPFVGVWIETGNAYEYLYSRFCHTLRGCVDWNARAHSGRRWSEVTPFVGVWIETLVSLTPIISLRCHTLRGCVDWNLQYVSQCKCSWCHTLRGCVDWNSIWLSMVS